MPTMSEITEAHSQRISRLAQDRDARMRDAAEARDRDLRALPGAARLYEAFEAQIAEARNRQTATGAKAETARTGALEEGSRALADALAEAQTLRRDTDVAAFEKRRNAEADAEHAFMVAIGAAAAAPVSTQAQKARAEKLDKARKEFDTALAANQERFRKSRDAALVAESRGSRDADRAFSAATRVGEASMKAARATAEQALAKALAALPEGAAELAEWRKATAAIVAGYQRAENEAFARFHREVQALEG